MIHLTLFNNKDEQDLNQFNFFLVLKVGRFHFSNVLIITTFLLKFFYYIFVGFDLFEGVRLDFFLQIDNFFLMNIFIFLDYFLVLVMLLTILL